MTLAEILQGLYEEHGQLTPEIVRDAARPADSPLHGYVFDRDTDDAAEAYFLDRAHRLIQRCRVLMRTSEDSTRRVRAWYAIPGEDSAYIYEPHAVIVKVPAKAEAALTEAVRRVQQAQAAVDDLDTILSSAGPGPQGPKRAARALKRAEKELVK